MNDAQLTGASGFNPNKMEIMTGYFLFTRTLKVPVLCRFIGDSKFFTELDSKLPLT